MEYDSWWRDLFLFCANLFPKHSAWADKSSPHVPWSSIKPWSPESFFHHLSRSHAYGRVRWLGGDVLATSGDCLRVPISAVWWKIRGNKYQITRNIFWLEFSEWWKNKNADIVWPETYAYEMHSESFSIWINWMLLEKPEFHESNSNLLVTAGFGTCYHPL